MKDFIKKYLINFIIENVTNLISFLAYDSFTDANNTQLQNHTPEIGGPWTLDVNGNFTINSNKLKHTGTGAENSEAVIPVPVGNYTIDLDITAGGNTGFDVWDILFAWNLSLHNGYMFSMNMTAQTISLIRSDLSEVVLDSTSFTIVQGNTYSLHVSKNGSNITCSIGETVLSANDNTYNYLNVGILASDDTLPNEPLSFDNFIVRPL